MQLRSCLFQLVVAARSQHLHPSTAFVVVIVILLLVIFVAGGGIIYLLREEGQTSARGQWQSRRRIGRVKGAAAHTDVDDEDEDALGQRSRGAYQRQGSSDSALHGGENNSSGWAASIQRLFWKARRKNRHQPGGILPSSDSTYGPQGQMRPYSSNPAPPGRQQGWMQAASESDWDLRHNVAHGGGSGDSSNNNHLRMVERRQTDSPLMSGNSPRSSYLPSGVPSYHYSASRMTTAESISSSVVRFDDSVNLPVRHGGAAGGLATTPSILSGRYFASPTTSPTGSSTALPLASPTSPMSRSVSPVHQNHTIVPSAAPSSSSHSAQMSTRPANWQQKLPSRMTMTSASEVSLAQSESYPSHEYVLANHSPFPAPSPSIRTFGSGSRFVEGL